MEHTGSQSWNILSPYKSSLVFDPNPQIPIELPVDPWSINNGPSLETLQPDDTFTTVPVRSFVSDRYQQIPIELPVDPWFINNGPSLETLQPDDTFTTVQVPSFVIDWYQQIPIKLPVDPWSINNGPSLETLQPDDTFTTVPVPSFPDGIAKTYPNQLSQQLFNSRDNSQRDDGGGVVYIEPDPKDLDHAGQASNGRIHKDDEARMPPLGNANSQWGTSSRGCNEKKRKGPQLTEEEQVQKQKKRQNDKKYRQTLKMERKKLQDLEKRVSGCGGIDQIESELPRLRQIAAYVKRFQQSTGTELGRLHQMLFSYGGIEKMKSMLDKYKELETKNGGIEKLEADSNKLNRIKSILESNEEEFIVNKVKRIDETEPAKNRIKKMGVQLEKQKQMVSRKEVESFKASHGSQLDKRELPLLDSMSNFDNVPDQLGIHRNSFTIVRGIAPTMQYSDGLTLSMKTP